MVELVVIRHGQSVADIEDRYEGQADFPLTELGKSQAKLLAEWMQCQYTPDVIFSSTLKRAKETAEIIQSVNSMDIILDNDLVERSNGIIAGMLKEEANIKFPVPANGWKRHESGQDAENEIEVRARAEKFISKLLSFIAENPSLKRIGIVSHGFYINMLFRSFLNLPYDSNVFIPTGDTGIHIWKYKEGIRMIEKINMQDHLRANK